jgi:hypothetical protein
MVGPKPACGAVCISGLVEILFCEPDRKCACRALERPPRSRLIALLSVPLLVGADATRLIAVRRPSAHCVDRWRGRGTAASRRTGVRHVLVLLEMEAGVRVRQVRPGGSFWMPQNVCGVGTKPAT